MSNFYARGEALCKLDNRSDLVVKLMELLREADSTPTKVVEVESQEAMKTISKLRGNLSQMRTYATAIANDSAEMRRRYTKAITLLRKPRMFNIKDIDKHWIDIIANPSRNQITNTVEEIGQIVGKVFGHTDLHKISAGRALEGVLCIGWSPQRFLSVLTAEHEPKCNVLFGSQCRERVLLDTNDGKLPVAIYA